MIKKEKEFLYDLLKIESPTGFEMPLQRKWTKYLQGFCDKVDCDAYGSSWGILEGKGEMNLVFAAHGDEIGFIVKQINEKGFLRLGKIGGIDASIARGRRLRILGDKGEVLGVIGNTATHLRKGKNNESVPKIHQLWVDVGAKNPREVAKLGIQIGNPAVYPDEPKDLSGDCIVARGLDNRLGAYIITQAMKKIRQAKKSLPLNVIALNTVHEEIGGQGARMVAQHLSPSVLICLDVTHSTDTPEINVAEHGEVFLGEGPTISHGSSNHPLVVKQLVNVGKKAKISLQIEASGSWTSTDLDSFYHSAGGIPSALISIPLRNMHSPVEVANLKDIQRTIDLLVAFALSLKGKENFAYSLK